MSKNSKSFDNFMDMFGDYYSSPQAAYDDYYSDESFTILSSLGSAAKSAGSSLKNAASSVGKGVSSGAANMMRTRTRAAMNGALMGAGFNFLMGRSVTKGALAGGAMGLAARSAYNSHVPGGIKGNLPGGNNPLPNSTSPTSTAKVSNSTTQNSGTTGSSGSNSKPSNSTSPDSTAQVSNSTTQNQDKENNGLSVVENRKGMTSDQAALRRNDIRNRAMIRSIERKQNTFDQGALETMQLANIPITR